MAGGFSLLSKSLEALLCRNSIRSLDGDRGSWHREHRDAGTRGIAGCTESVVHPVDSLRNYRLDAREPGMIPRISGPKTRRGYRIQEELPYMHNRHPATLAILFAVICTVLMAGVSAAEMYSLGDVVPLSGYSYGSQTAYLFLTGPNLPVNGVALDAISKRADQGWFTRVQVDSNDRWSYKWGTANVGGRLDEGTYTIWVVNGPNDRSRLSQADYSTISVTLGKPSISINTPVQPGAMDLRSVPDGASVVMDEQYRGKTPLTISDLAPGTYDVIFSQFGYQKFSTRVPVEAGRITEVTATLVPNAGALTITSVPAGASVLVDGIPAGIAPVTAENLTAGNHTVEVTLDGYTSLLQTVAVIPGRTLPVTIGLTPQTSQTTETTQAAGAAALPVVAVCVALLLLTRYVRRQ